MVSRNPPPRKPPAAPSGSESECMLLPLVARMAVDRPEGLAREPWASHLHACAACYEEASGHIRSVAVFRAVEGGRLAQRASDLTWESFLGGLERQRAEEERARRRARWAMPLAAAAAGVLTVAGVLGWDGLQDDTAAPARIVQMQPHQQRSMEELVRWALEPKGKPGDRALTISAAPQHPGGLGVEEPQSALPDELELAASVSPQDSNGLSAEQISTASARSPASPSAVEWPVQFTPPSRDRFPQTQPLFRLERRVVPTQAVSFPLHD